MARSTPETGSKAFGSWLSSEIRQRGLNQAEFAKAMGVGTSTVSRWVNGRVPEAVLLERIADVLVLDYDLVATRAGYRPKGLDELSEAERALLPIIRAHDWTPAQLRAAAGALRAIAEMDQGRE